MAESLASLVIPNNINFTYLAQEGDKKVVKDISTDTIFKGKRVVVFAVPGAFTPTCSKDHLPGFVTNADKIYAKGIDSIVCIAVNDPFVMDAWGSITFEREHITVPANKFFMLSDANATFTKAIKMQKETPVLGGVRSKRYALVVNDGVVVFSGFDESGCSLSAAKEILAHL